MLYLFFIGNNVYEGEIGMEPISFVVVGFIGYTAMVVVPSIWEDIAAAQA
jgi:hypothetical protein